jgi:hypothetical protein
MRRSYFPQKKPHHKQIRHGPDHTQKQADSTLQPYNLFLLYIKHNAGMIDRRNEAAGLHFRDRGQSVLCRC